VIKPTRNLPKRPIGRKISSTTTAMMLLFRSHKSLWLALLFIVTTMILLFSYLLLIKTQVSNNERSQLGLVATAHLAINTPEGMPLNTAHQIAQNINATHQALVVPLNRITALKCRFFNYTDYIKETSMMVDGYQQWVDKKVYSWVANGEFTLTLNQLDLSVSTPQFTLLTADFDVIGHFDVVEFDQSASKLALGAMHLQQLDTTSHYYFSYAPVANAPLGPFTFDPSSGYFMLLGEEDLPPEQLPLLANTQQTLKAFVAAIYRQHLPFLPGAAVDQMQLASYEYSSEQRQHNNKIMLNSLLFNPDTEGLAANEPNSITDASRTFLSAALFDKVFPNAFDYKILRFDCGANPTNDTKAIKQIAAVYGHYYLKPNRQQNPNQVFLPFNNKGESTATINGFLIKDLGQINAAIKALTAQLQLHQHHHHHLDWQISTVDQRLPSYSLFIFITIVTILAMAAILLALTLPLRRVMIQDMFLVKFYGGYYVMAVMLCCLLLFPLAMLMAWGFGMVIMQTINSTILAPYNVPLMRFDPQFFVSGSLYVFTLWLVIWTWLAFGLKKIVNIHA
jgi:hypothetical protein